MLISPSPVIWGSDFSPLHSGIQTTGDLAICNVIVICNAVAGEGHVLTYALVVTAPARNDVTPILLARASHMATLDFEGVCKCDVT